MSDESSDPPHPTLTEIVVVTANRQLFQTAAWIAGVNVLYTVYRVLSMSCIYHVLSMAYISLYLNHVHVHVDDMFQFAQHLTLFDHGPLTRSAPTELRAPEGTKLGSLRPPTPSLCPAPHQVSKHHPVHSIVKDLNEEL